MTVIQWAFGIWRTLYRERALFGALVIVQIILLFEARTHHFVRSTSLSSLPSSYFRKTPRSCARPRRAVPHSVEKNPAMFAS